VQVRDGSLFERVVKGAFAQRRKKLRNALAGAFGDQLDGEGVARVLRAAGVDGDLRPEQLTIEDFSRLADAFLQEMETDQ
jgi:16S rRNA (adenine1518-N6/adenine1519-N6)-dimethyltransferase